MPQTEPEATDGRLIALLAGVGAAAGLLVRLVNHQAVPLPDPVVLGTTLGLIVGTVAFALLTDRTGRAAPVAALLAASVALLGALAPRSEPLTDAGEVLTVATVLASLALGFVVVIFACARAERRALHYPSLFEGAVGVPLTLGLALGFMGGVWLIAWLIASLFQAIGVDLIETLLLSEWVSLPLTGAATLAAIGTVRHRRSVMQAVQGILFALARLVAPVVGLAVAIFAGALLFQGLDMLWEDLSPVATLTATAALAGLLVNACIGAAGRPGRVPDTSASLLCVVLPILMGLAAYGLWVRLAAEGLTPGRLYAALLVGVGLAMALAYGLSGLTGRWAAARGANVGLLIAAAVLAIGVQTPLFRPLAWSANDQAERLLSGEVASEDFDYAYLRFGLGAAGERALDRIKAAKPALAARIDALDAYGSRYEAKAAQERAALLTDADWLIVRPAGVAVPPALAEAAAGYHQRGRGAVLLAFPDGAAGETAWLAARGFGDKVVVEVHHRTGEDWTELGYVVRQTDDPEATVATMADGLLGTERVVLTVPLIGGEGFESLTVKDRRLVEADVAD